MSYFEDQQSDYPFGSSIKGTIELGESKVRLMNEKSDVFRIQIIPKAGKDKDLTMEGTSLEECRSWVEAIEQHIVYATANGISRNSIDVRADSVSSRRSVDKGRK